ncbi:ATPase [Cellulophaga sp. Hel_I_12]|uniref:ATPase n=1 Tax=Cellulophaga sp. Hel_I_12 TaxID=1249972 RepID=UPI000646FAEC|nr:ATPase [Cellulophaga sp. Hel_I_12]
MNLHHPNIIIEGDSHYTLGTLRGNKVFYDFDKMLLYLNAKGKLLFGKDFKIFEEDHPLVYKLCNYFIKDVGNCRKFDIDIHKGLLLSGPVGCGKTSLMKLLRYLVPHQRPYEVIPARNITFGFNNVGFKIIEAYGDKKFYCFDDLGIEPTGKYFGKDCNVLGEILLSRHDLFLNHNIMTHATTNLNAQELEERYGSRVRSRMRELFNLIAFDENTGDKRK